MQKYQNRSEVPETYKWNLDDFYQNEEEFNISLEECKKKVAELKDYVGCTKNAHKLYEFLTKELETIILWEDLYIYAYLINDQELGISSNIERKNKTISLNSELSSNISFFAPELLTLSKSEYEQLFKDEPKLKEFSADLDHIYRDKDYVLSKEEERIIAELSNICNKYEDISSNMLNNEHDYGKIKLEDGSSVSIATTNYRFLMKNKNVAIRKKIYNLFNQTLNRYASTSAELLNGYASLNNQIAKIHHHQNAWSAKLFNLNLTEDVYKSLIGTTEKNIPILQKYFRLRKKVLGLDQLHLYDNSLELVENNKEYSIEEAQDLIRKSLQPLGAEYIKKYNKIIDNHYIDYCQYKGKCSGGYSMAALNKDSRILLSYNYDLSSVSTIAHESGHNVHHQFVNESNPTQYREVSSLVAEVISLTNECLLSSYLASNGSTKEEKLSGISNIISVIISNLYGAVREGSLELEMYKHLYNNGSLTKEFLNDITTKSLKKYYGNTIKLDKFAGNGWITRSHYYMNFYLFNYAICISIACDVAKKILDGDKEMLSNYYQFMKCGSDIWPIDAFKILKVDITKPDVYQNAIDYFDSLITKFEEIYNEKEVK